MWPQVAEYNLASRGLETHALACTTNIHHYLHACYMLRLYILRYLISPITFGEMCKLSSFLWCQIIRPFITLSLLDPSILLRTLSRNVRALWQ